MPHPAVTATNLTIVLDGRLKAIDDISFEVATGSITGLIGPSGAGKTTLIRGIVGRQRLSGGNLQVLGRAAGTATLRQQVSYMTQQVSVYPDLTVQENLSYFAAMLGLPGKERAARTAEILQAVDMASQTGQLAGKLSGGQRQRVSLAIALIGKPKLMVLDEPTVGLDPVLREQLWSLFRHLSGQGTTLLVSSHAMDEAERCADLLLIREGKLLAQGSPHQLRERTGTGSVEESFLKLVGKPS